MRIYILLLASLTLAACAIKPVQTVYYEKEDVTRFTTQSFKAEKKNKENEKRSACEIVNLIS